MNTPRETIAAAILTLLAPLAPAPFKSVNRAPRIWSDVDPTEQPCLSLIHVAEGALQDQANGVTRWTMDFHLLGYCRADAVPAPLTIPDQQINALLDAIEHQLEPTPRWGRVQTLGGLVANCFIEGEVLIDTGILDQQCAFVVPIRVITGV